MNTFESNTISEAPKTTEANIEVKKNQGRVVSVSVIMPTWNKVEDDHSFTTITIPLFGLKTIAIPNNDSDAVTAINEALKCFCISAEKFGQGIEKELQSLGWSLVNSDQESSLLNYSISSSDVVLEQIMETGDQFAENDLMFA